MLGEAAWYWAVMECERRSAIMMIPMMMMMRTPINVCMCGCVSVWSGQRRVCYSAFSFAGRTRVWLRGMQGDGVLG